MVDIGVRVVSGNVVTQAEPKPLIAEHQSPLFQRLALLDTVWLGENPDGPGLGRGSPDQVEGGRVPGIISHREGQEIYTSFVLNVFHYQVLNEVNEILLLSSLMHTDHTGEIVKCHTGKSRARNVKPNDIWREFYLSCSAWIDSPMHIFAIWAAWIQRCKLCSP